MRELCDEKYVSYNFRTSIKSCKIPAGSSEPFGIIALSFNGGLVLSTLSGEPKWTTPLMKFTKNMQQEYQQLYILHLHVIQGYIFLLNHMWHIINI